MVLAMTRTSRSRQKRTTHLRDRLAYQRIQVGSSWKPPHATAQCSQLLSAWAENHSRSGESH